MDRRRPGKILIDERAIARRLDELAGEIRAELPSPDPLLVGLMTGSFMFMADLGRALSRVGVQPQVEFVTTSHYGDDVKPVRRATLDLPLRCDARGRAVLLVDDILDTGDSLEIVRSHVEASAPSWIRSCVLLDKRVPRREGVRADFVGFRVPDTWVVGYGLDLAGRYRELPHVAELESPGDASAP